MYVQPKIVALSLDHCCHGKANLRSIYCCATCVADNKKKHVGFHVNCPIFLSDIKNIGFSQQIFIKVPNVKFHSNPPSGSRADICGQTDRWEDFTELIGTFRDHAKASKIGDRKICMNKRYCRKTKNYTLIGISF
jgi:hypothetical protein